MEQHVDDLGRLVNAAKTFASKTSAVRQLAAVLSDALKLRDSVAFLRVRTILDMLVSMTEHRDWVQREAGAVGLGFAAAEFAVADLESTCTCTHSVNVKATGLLKRRVKWSLCLEDFDAARLISFGEPLGLGPRDACPDDNWSDLSREERCNKQRSHVMRIIGAEAVAATDSLHERAATTAAVAVAGFGDVITDTDLFPQADAPSEPHHASANVSSTGDFPSTGGIDESIAEPIEECSACAFSGIFSDAFSLLSYRLFRPAWESRHGAAMALRYVLEHIGPVLMRETSVSHATCILGCEASGSESAAALGDSSNSHGSVILQDCIVRCIALLALDRFGDYSAAGTGVVAPVRAAAAQVLSLACFHLTRAGFTRALDALLELAQHADWNVRHGSFLGLLNTLAVAAQLASSITASNVQGEKLPIHGDQDARALSIALLSRACRACERAMIADSSEDVVTVAAGAAVELMKHGNELERWISNCSADCDIKRAAATWQAVPIHSVVPLLQRLHSLSDLSSPVAGALMQVWECALVSDCIVLESSGEQTSTTTPYNLSSLLPALAALCCRFLLNRQASTRQAALSSLSVAIQLLNSVVPSLSVEVSLRSTTRVLSCWWFEHGFPNILRALWPAVLLESSAITNSSTEGLATLQEDAHLLHVMWSMLLSQLLLHKESSFSTPFNVMLPMQSFPLPLSYSANSRGPAAGALSSGVPKAQAAELFTLICLMLRRSAAANSFQDVSWKWFNDAFISLCSGNGEVLNGPAMHPPLFVLPPETMTLFSASTPGPLDFVEPVTFSKAIETPVANSLKRKRATASHNIKQKCHVEVDDVASEHCAVSVSAVNSAAATFCGAFWPTAVTDPTSEIDTCALIATPSCRVFGSAAFGMCLATVAVRSIDAASESVPFLRLRAAVCANGQISSLISAASAVASFSITAAALGDKSAFAVCSAASTDLDSAIGFWINDSCGFTAFHSDSPSDWWTMSPVSDHGRVLVPIEVQSVARRAWEACVGVICVVKNAVSSTANKTASNFPPNALTRFMYLVAGSTSIVNINDAIPSAPISRLMVRFALSVSAAAAYVSEEAHVCFHSAAQSADLALQLQQLQHTLSAMQMHWRATRAEVLGALLASFESVRSVAASLMPPSGYVPTAPTLSVKNAIAALLRVALEANDVETRKLAAQTLAVVILRIARRTTCTSAIDCANLLGLGQTVTDRIIIDVLDELARTALIHSSEERCLVSSTLEIRFSGMLLLLLSLSANDSIAARLICHVESRLLNPGIVIGVGTKIGTSEQTVALLCLSALFSRRFTTMQHSWPRLMSSLDQVLAAVLMAPTSLPQSSESEDSSLLDISLQAAALAARVLCVADFDSWCLCMWKTVLPVCRGDALGPTIVSAARRALFVLSACLSEPSMQVRTCRFSIENSGVSYIALELAVGKLASLFVGALLPCLAHACNEVRVLAASVFRLVARLVALETPATSSLVESGGSNSSVVLEPVDWPAAMLADCARGRDVVRTLQAGAWHGLRRMPVSTAELVLGDIHSSSNRASTPRGNSAIKLQLLCAHAPQLPSAVLPSNLSPLRCSLRVYQLQAVNWLNNLRAAHLGGVLADDMGTGKTIVSVCAIACAAAASMPSETADGVSVRESSSILAPSSRRVSLVVAPSSLLHHWEREITSNYGSDAVAAMGNGGLEKGRCRAVILDPIVYSSDAATRIQQLADLVASTSDGGSRSLRHTVLIVSYSQARRDAEQLSSLAYCYAVLDEGHIVANPDTALWRAVHRLGASASHRIVLTGTPIQNGVTDAWALFDFVMPGYLGDWALFKSRVAATVRKAAAPTASASDLAAADALLARLHRQLMPFVLRRLKSDVLSELPPRTIQDVVCELTPLQAHLHHALLECSVDALQAVCVRELLTECGEDEGAVEEGERQLLAASLPSSAASSMSMSSSFACVHLMRRLINHPALLTATDLSMICRTAGERTATLSTKAAAAMRTVSVSCKFVALRELLEMCLVLPLRESKSGDRMQNRKSAEAADVEASEEACEALLASSAATAALSEQRSKVLIFAQSPNVLDLIQDILLLPAGLQLMPGKSTAVAAPSFAGSGSSRVRSRVQNDASRVGRATGLFARIDASHSSQQRAETAMRFNTLPDIHLLMLTTRVGGLGLNLTGANVVIFIDHSWNPFADLQAMDRVHRLGQSRPVTVYRLVARDTLEARIMGIQRFKEHVAEAVIAGSNRSIGVASTASSIRVEEADISSSSLPDDKIEGMSVLDLLAGSEHAGAWQPSIAKTRAQATIGVQSGAAVLVGLEDDSASAASVVNEAESLDLASFVLSLSRSKSIAASKNEVQPFQKKKDG